MARQSRFVFPYRLAQLIGQRPSKRIQGTFPADEGILIVKERKKGALA